MLRRARVAVETRLLADIDRATGPGAWQTIFESQPCVPMYGAGAMRGKNPFRGEEIGGRLVLLDANTLAAVARRSRLLRHRGRSCVCAGSAGLLRQDDPHRSENARGLAEHARAPQSAGPVRRVGRPHLGNGARGAGRRRAEPADAGRELRLAGGHLRHRLRRAHLAVEQATGPPCGLHAARVLVAARHRHLEPRADPARALRDLAR